jgi:hypothetical protein
MKENLPAINHQAIEEPCDEHLILDRTQDEKPQSLRVKDSPIVKEVGIQTEPFIPLSMANIDQTHELINGSYSDEPIKEVPAWTNCKTKRNNTWSSNGHGQILKAISSKATFIIGKQCKFWSRFRFTNISTKLFTSILLTTIIIFHLLSGSTIVNKGVNSMTLTNLHMISIDVIFQNVKAIFVATIIPYSSILSGPSRSSFELWPYPFAIP